VRSSAATSPFRGRAVAILAFGVAFGYVEAAVVVYLRRALGLEPGPLFPVREASAATSGLVAIELGRELATIVMLAGIGWATGRRGLDRLAWSAVAFGAWDIAYYGWLWVMIGWPSTLDTWDLLFLVPLPWVGPVWAPVAVSAALVGFGLAAARLVGEGRELRLDRRHVAAGVAGGVLVVGSFLVDAGNVAAGGVPASYAWPVFAAGMLVAAAAAVDALRGPATLRRGDRRSPEEGPTAAART
jgi:hypothetical protein